MHSPDQAVDLSGGRYSPDHAAPRQWGPVGIVTLGVTLGLLVAAAIWVFWDDGETSRPPAAGGLPGAIATGGDLPYLSGIGSGTPGPTESPTAPPATRSAPPPASAASVRFTADYASTSTWAEGFVGEVVVRNVGGSSGAWTVEVVMPPGASLADAWNAPYQRTGRTLRFTASGDLAAGASIRFGFRVLTQHGEQVPEACRVDGRPCT